jgi:hypothetical protein
MYSASEPPVCDCGHYFYVHAVGSCGNWERKDRRMLRLPFGFYVTLLRRCKCKGDR